MTNEHKQIDRIKWKAGLRRAASITLHTLKWMFLLGVVGGCLVFGVAFGYMSALVKDDPVRSKDMIFDKIRQNEQTGFVYFQDGTVVGQLRSEIDRRVIAYKDIPELVKDAFFAIEDNRFFDHYGVDMTGLLRAVKQKLMNEDVQTGGSTITQQLARRVFLNLDKTDSRKFKEILLSLRLERYLSKEEILEAYLNKIPFGNGSTGYNLYGIKAAAKGIFNIDDLSKVNIAQAAYLAGLPQQPSTYSAFTSNGQIDREGLQAALKRQKLVLKRMFEERKITSSEYEEASRFNIEASLAKPAKKAYSTYPYLMLETERQAAEQLLILENPDLTREELRKPENADLLKDAREQLLNGGYRVYTTIDKQMYDRMQEIARNSELFSKDHPEKGVEQVGAMLIENRTGAILAMMEGRDFYLEQLNHATQMVRQPGSAMKPLGAFLPALEQGKVQPASIIDDVPIILKDGQKGFHLPKNHNDKYQGLITARHALNQSYNIPALKIFNDMVGIEAAWTFVKSLGISTLTEEDNHARTGVIGGLTYGVSVEEITNAYSSIGNRGELNDAYLIAKIADVKGNVIYQHKTEPQRVFTDQTAYLMTDMLKTVITNGTAATVKREFKYGSKVPIAGKTGTTSDDHDVWFIGFSPDVTLGVWTGYDQPTPLTKPGRNRAKLIWAEIMNSAYELKQEWFVTNSFEKPENIVEATVSSASGKLPSELSSQLNMTVKDIFNKEFLPTEQDDVIVVMKVVSFEGNNYIPLPSTPEDMVSNSTVVKRTPSIKELMTQIKALLDKQPDSKDKKPLEYYYPDDKHLDAPTEVDPRTDDGQSPAAPSEVKLTRKPGKNEITFAGSPSKDIVGYRLYRSINGSSFTVVGRVLTGAPSLTFINFIDPNQQYEYYITAVDVAGKESIPSSIVNMSDGGGSGEASDSDGSVGEATLDTGEILDSQSAEGAPSAPQNVNGSVIEGGGAVTLRWDVNPAAEAVTRYTIYYSESENSGYKQIGTSNIPSFEYINLPVTGWYRITAENAKGVSSPSLAVYVQEP